MTSKVLCLHGYATSAEFMKFQLDHSRFRQNFGELLQFKELDGTYEVQRPKEAPEIYQGPFRAWWMAQLGEDIVYEGWEETLERVEAMMMRDGPFDGLLGFSQGACLASLLIGLQQRGRCLREHPPLKFAFFIGGFASRDAKHGDAYIDPIRCPSCHIIGERDDHVEAGRKLSDHFIDPVVIEHPSGHKIPKLDDANIQRIDAFVKSAVSASKL